MLLLALPEPRRYVYDEENRLTAVTDIDDVALFEIDYDALGRRIETRDYGDDSDPCDLGDTMVTTRHAYAGLNAIEEYVWCDDNEDEATAPSEWLLAREFLWGDRFPEPLMMVDHTDAGEMTAAEGAEVLHYVRDALGSVVGLVDADDPDATPDPIPAKLVERYDYDPYGKTYVEYWDATAGGGAGAWIRTADAASHFGNPFMWTSQRYDQTVGLYHFPFRSYSPELGRWLQRDPLGYVDGVSLYQYVGSHPTMFADPLGLYVDKDVIQNPDGTITWNIYDRGVTGWFKNDYIGSITFDPEDDYEAWQAQYTYDRLYNMWGTVRDVGQSLEVAVLVGGMLVPGPEDFVFPAFKLLGEVLGLSAKEAAQALRLRELAEAVGRIPKHARDKHYRGEALSTVMRRIIDMLKSFDRMLIHPDGRIIFVKGRRVLIINPKDMEKGGTMFEPDDIYGWLRKRQADGFAPSVCGPRRDVIE